MTSLLASDDVIVQINCIEVLCAILSLVDAEKRLSRDPDEALDSLAPVVIAALQIGADQSGRFSSSTLTSLHHVMTLLKLLLASSETRVRICACTIFNYLLTIDQSMQRSATTAGLSGLFADTVLNDKHLPVKLAAAQALVQFSKFLPGKESLFPAGVARKLDQLSRSLKETSNEAENPRQWQEVVLRALLKRLVVDLVPMKSVGKLKTGK